MNSYRFTGDRRKLKKEGYTFYSTFYSNDVLDILSKHKGKIKVPGLLDKHQEKFIDFILENEDKNVSFWVMDIVYSNPKVGTLHNMPIYCMTQFGNIMNVDDFYEKRHTTTEERRTLQEDNSPEAQKASLEFFENNEFIKDPKYFGKETINAINALVKAGGRNKDVPEKIESTISEVEKASQSSPSIKR